MAKKGPNTGSKYQLLLATAQNRSCYNPECDEPLLVERSGHAVSNFEFAHIRDEFPPADANADIGWRYWPDDLTQAERNHFSNIILLCNPCHKLVDRLDPRSFSVEDLHDWKQAVEQSAGAELAGVLGTASAAERQELLLMALSELEPERKVVPSIGLGFIIGSDLIKVPVEGFAQVAEQNPYLRAAERAVVLEVVNHGLWPVSVTSFDLEFRRPGRDKHPVLVNPNPSMINPRPPVSLQVGEVCHWIFSIEQLQVTWVEWPEVAAFTELAGIVHLATGERFESDEILVESVPMWTAPEEVAQIAEMARKIREVAASSESSEQ